MLREHVHGAVDRFFDLPASVLGNEHAALACHHLRAARREILRALRARLDSILCYMDKKPDGEPLVRVEVEGGNEVAG
jgi:hypothetical protein